VAEPEIEQVMTDWEDRSMAEQRSFTRRNFADVLAGSGMAVPALVAQQAPQQTPAQPTSAQQVPPASTPRRGPAPEVPPFEGPTIRSKEADPTSWIKPGDKPLTFRTVGQQKDLTLEPLYWIFDRRYIVYWQVS
jgi:hypothetical protein